MVLERPPNDGTRELRLEGAGLVVIGGILLAGIVGAFFLGRWVERRAHPPAVMGAEQPGPLSQVVEVGQLEDTTTDADYFDAVGGDRQAEPGREVAAEPETRAEEQPAKVDPAPEKKAAPLRQPSRTAAEVAEPDDADYYVQVFAGRDRTAAETLVSKLKRQGYTVRVFSEREGRGALFKVRVGGFPTEERARLIASDLRDSGYDGAWVTLSE